jgi:hypothetical protein
MERKDKRMYPEDVGAGSSGGKRRRHVFTIQQKVEVLRKTDRGVSVSQLRQEYSSVFYYCMMCFCHFYENG